MGWFGRKRDPDEKASGAEAPGAAQGSAAQGLTGQGSAGPLVDDPDAPLRPTSAPLGTAEREHIDRALAELADAGVDVDDLESIGSGLDAAAAEWEAGGEAGDHHRVVERFAVGIGEHLHRHTDLRWAMVTDAFGTDLAVTGSGRKEFVVVPSNLVAVRWLRRERGWVPGVVGHIVRMRTER